MATKKKSEPKAIVTFKGFDAEFKCRGFQYEVGATYTHDGTVAACESGFHACENPLDVLQYYPIINDQGKVNRFAIVEQSGKLAKHDEDSKIASASITIKAELSIPEFVKQSVDWLLTHCKKSKKKSQSSDKDSAKLAASGNSAQLAASGDSAKLAASGYSAKLAASGDFAQLAASGNSAKLAASGYFAQLAASGDSAKLAASGYSAQLAASGKDSVIASSSISSIAKGAEGTWISLAEFDGNNKCVGFATGCIGKDGLLPDVFYRASGGKLVKA